jgi:Tol biopolymer transport system component
MVTGHRAFEGKSQLSVASAILEKEPASISSIKPLIPRSLDHIICRCLAKDPDQRWQSAGDLAGELRWIGERGSQDGVPALRKSLKLVLGLLAAVLAIASLVLGIAYMRSRSAPLSPLATYILPPANVAFNIGRVISPDGTHIAFSGRSVEGKVSIWVRALDSTATQELAGTENGLIPFWSPDSQWIGFFANGRLRKIPAAGGSAQDICDAPNGRGGSWNSQGIVVFAPGSTGVLQKVSAKGGTPSSITQLDESTGEQTHRWPDFLPDGEHFLYLARQVSEKAPAAVYVGSLDGNFRKRVLETTSNAQYVEPGYLLFVREFTLFAQRFDATQLTLLGDAIPIAFDVQRQVGSLWDGVSASRAGKILYTPIGFDSDIEFTVTDRSGNLLTEFRGGGQMGGMVRVSPDGRKVASSVYGTVKENSGVWIHDLATHLSARLVFTDAYYGSAVWSPDGSQIAFSSSKTGPFNMYVKAVNGSGEEKALHPSPDDERPRSWSPDGKYLIFDRRSASRLGSSEVMVFPLDSSEKPYSLLNASDASQIGSVSPDGRWIAFTSAQSGNNEVYVSTFPRASGIWQVSTTGGTAPRWRRDGRGLFYVRPDGPIMITEVKPGLDSLAVGSTSEILKAHVPINSLDASFDVFPDGQRFVMSTVRKGSLHAPLTLLTNWPSLLSPK